MSDQLEETLRRHDAETPSRTLIKICGLRDVQTALAAAEAGADFIGLNFVEASPRYVETEVAREIVQALPADVEPVGLFCDHPVDTLRAVTDAVGLKTVQLHGDETPDQARQLDGLNILKALGFAPDKLSQKLESWKRFEGQLVALLIDTPPRSDATITGGSGESFDWSALAAHEKNGGLDASTRYMLAGGLTPPNVGRAIEIARPWGVDVSSGVESSRGVKDPAMIADFCAAVRDADASLGVA